MIDLSNDSSCGMTAEECNEHQLMLKAKKCECCSVACNICGEMRCEHDMKHFYQCTGLLSFGSNRIETSLMFLIICFSFFVFKFK